MCRRDRYPSVNPQWLRARTSATAPSWRSQGRSRHPGGRHHSREVLGGSWDNVADAHPGCDLVSESLDLVCDGAPDVAAQYAGALGDDVGNVVQAGVELMERQSTREEQEGASGEKLSAAA